MRRKFHDKLKRGAVIPLLFSLFFAACAKEPISPLIAPESSVEYEECPGCPLMETETGYYYNDFTNSLYELHYVDKTTGKNVILCNRPECKHDGNEFCVGTNKKYAPFGFQLHDGAIYMAAICDGESSHDFKLVRIALDGSSLSEVGTVYSTNLAANNPPVQHINEDDMIICGDTALFQICLGGNDNMEDTIAYGTFFYDLKTGEVKQFFEEAISTENPVLESITVRGDNIYFVTLDGKKHILHRYSTLTGTDEELQLQRNFSGTYAVMDDGTIYYVRNMKKKLAVLYPDGKNQDLGEISCFFTAIPDLERLPASFDPNWFLETTHGYTYWEISMLASNGASLFASPFSNGGGFLTTPSLTEEGMNALHAEYDTSILVPGVIVTDYSFLPLNYTDPETGEVQHLSVYYSGKPGNVIFSRMRMNGTVEKSLYPCVVKDAVEDMMHHRYTYYQVYMTYDKIYIRTEYVDYNSPTPDAKYYYSVMELSDFMRGMDFPEPLVTLSSQ